MMRVPGFGNFHKNWCLNPLLKYRHCNPHTAVLPLAGHVLVTVDCYYNQKNDLTIDIVEGAAVAETVVAVVVHAAVVQIAAAGAATVDVASAEVAAR